MSRTLSALLARRRAAALLLGASLGALTLPTAAQAITPIRVNFQPKTFPSGGTVPIPKKYTAEFGEPYSAVRGFGFMRLDTRVPFSALNRTRDRGLLKDQLLDTLVHMSRLSSEPSDAPTVYWEAAVPPGDYIVRVGAGDPAQFDSTHRVNVEGVPALDFVATSATRSAVGQATVRVTDGRLTLNAVGGSNTKLQFVEIADAPIPIFTKKFNFQRAEGDAVGGTWIREAGAPFSDTSGYGWVTASSLSTSTHVPLDMASRMRDRNGVSDQRMDTFAQMQYPTSEPAAAWELRVPIGTYDVTVAVGDPLTVDANHLVRVEGRQVVAPFNPSMAPNPDGRFRESSATVTVADGRLTVDAIGGANTKINSIRIDAAPAGARPSAEGVLPADGELYVSRDAGVSTEVSLPTAGAGVDESTLPGNVRLENVATGAVVDSLPGTSGGSDVITLKPVAPLAHNTQYRFSISSGVRDLSGAAFVPKTTVFTTNAMALPESTLGAFTQHRQASSNGTSSASVVMGPDHLLYATTLQGEILRFPVASDGTLGTPTTISTVKNHEGGMSRHILGLVFDRASTATAPILWVSHGVDTYQDAPDWSGKISRLSGANLGTIQDYVIGLPRAVRDHETNSLALGPDGALYATQGSNSAAGRADANWGNRPERVLSASVLRIDPAAIDAPPLNVKSGDGGTYDPFSPGAPVTVYASGIRNAYDLVFHSNGQLYVPANGTAEGGNTPAPPSPLPSACQRRLDVATSGAWTGPSVPQLTNVAAQPDLLFRVEKNGYYGHPNPMRCEYTFFTGNPTFDPTKPVAVLQPIGAYPSGTPPDRNFRQPVHNFGLHQSPDGAIEYKSDRFGGKLKGRLLVARYSVGDDVVALSVDPATNITRQEPTMRGLTGFANPLDIAEDTRNGNLYVTEYAPESGISRITLLRPDEAAVATG